MHISRIYRVLFWGLMVACIHGLLLSGWRTVDYFQRLGTSSSLWMGAKFFCYGGFLWIGLLLFQLFRMYRQHGFFGNESVQTVRWIGVLLVGISVFNSVFNVLRDEVIGADPDRLIGWQAFLFHFVLDYLFESPVLLFLSLLVFLFAAFMQQAIDLKKDNEAII